MTPQDPVDDWAVRFEQAGLVGRAKLLAGGAVRLTANLLDRALDRAATTAAGAERAFRRELDPNVSDAKIIEEVDERRSPRGGSHR
ncbi:MAG: hypothetical protein R3181_14515 [Rubricoccaceae bacterium]|nr:hypothetical protein [Rubricoccaceae bacterium]